MYILIFRNKTCFLVIVKEHFTFDRVVTFPGGEDLDTCLSPSTSK